MLFRFHLSDLRNTEGVITRQGCVLINTRIRRGYKMELWFWIVSTLIIHCLLGLFLCLSFSKRRLFSFTINLPNDGHLHICSFISVLILAKVLKTIRKVRYLSDLGGVRQELVYTTWCLNLLRTDRV